jgi:hypothetical protein
MRSVASHARQRYHSTLPSGTSSVDEVSLEFISVEGIETAFVLDDDFAVSGVRRIP